MQEQVAPLEKAARAPAEVLSHGMQEFWLTGILPGGLNIHAQSAFHTKIMAKEE